MVSFLCNISFFLGVKRGGRTDTTVDPSDPKMTEIAFYVMFAAIKVFDQTATTSMREVRFLGVIFSKVIF